MSEHPRSDDRIEELTRLLEVGWARHQAGDLTSAEHKAREAAALVPDDPEALTLLGSVRAAQGEADQALTLFQQALASDPDHVAPMLQAAELLLGSNPEEALRFADRALEVAEEEEDYLDAALYRVEALLVLERNDDALAELAALPPAPLANPGFEVWAARAYLDLGHLDGAREHYLRALDLDGGYADAHHGLGLVAHAIGDIEAGARAWRMVRRLDAAQPDPPWHLPPTQFEQIAQAALAELPPRALELLANVPVLVADLPSRRLIDEGTDPRLLGLFAGTPFPEKGAGGGDIDCITLYQRNIERVCRSTEEVRHEVRITLLHETGHFFGLSEEGLEELGLG